jgi:hypothetical protein
VTLSDIPLRYWQDLAAQGYDAVWLMGVWQSSRASAQLVLDDPVMTATFDTAVPGWQPADVRGSPYAIHSYILDRRLGAPGDLATVKRLVNSAGLSLFLDFVPNHLAVDHPWTTMHPDHLIRGTAQDLLRDPDVFFRSDGQGACFAHGRDPYFPSWKDTVQVNYFSAAAREAMVRYLLDIAPVADGVRCDMAMLVLSRVFSGTWGRFGTAPRQEFWQEAIARVKNAYPAFIFIAEAYWDLEWELQQLGFDYTYDKRLYDRLLAGPAAGISLHLRAGADFQAHSLRFTENHDENRAVTAFGRERSFAAAAIMANVPGLHLFHDGQADGKTVHQPIQLAREATETPDREAADFYRRLLRYTRLPALPCAPLHLCRVTATGGENADGLLALYRECGAGTAKLTAVNYSPRRVRASVRLQTEGPSLLQETLTGERSFSPRGEYLPLALSPWQVCLFEISPSTSGQSISDMRQ